MNNHHWLIHILIIANEIPVPIELNNAPVTVAIGHENVPAHLRHLNRRGLTKVRGIVSLGKALAKNQRRLAERASEVKLEDLMQGDVCEPVVPLRVDGHAVWHVENARAPSVSDRHGVGVEHGEHVLFYGAVSEPF